VIAVGSGRSKQGGHQGGIRAARDRTEGGLHPTETQGLGGAPGRSLVRGDDRHEWCPVPSLASPPVVATMRRPPFVLGPEHSPRPGTGAISARGAACPRPPPCSAVGFGQAKPAGVTPTATENRPSVSRWRDVAGGIWAGAGVREHGLSGEDRDDAVGGPVDRYLERDTSGGDGDDADLE